MPAKIPENGETILVMDRLDSSLFTATDVKRWTQRNAVLSRVTVMIQTGWPDQCPDVEFRPYFQRRNELSLECGCIMWGSRIIIPPQGQQTMLNELHEMHPGICRMKALARSYMWWPNMDADIQRTVENCQPCQVNRKAPEKALLHPWEYTDRPWVRLHVRCGLCRAIP